MNKSIGIAYAIIGSIFWGTSGTVAEYLFARQHLDPLWLVGIRLFGAGLMLLLWYAIKHGHKIFSIWHNKNNIIKLVLFAFLGMLPSQLTYFMAIKYGNAPTATVLQFLGPLFIIGYLTVFQRVLPRRIDIFSVLLALAGTFLLVTNGQVTHLVLGPAALFWGIAAGLSQASYTLLPRRLLSLFNDRLVVGWAMLLSSLPFTGVITTHSWSSLDVMTIAGIGFIVIFGTMFAYLFYLKSLKSLLPATTGMLSAFEPLTATVLSVTFLSTPFSLIQAMGGILVLSTTVIQALPSKKYNKKVEE
ncbi:DMT family transporter [Liquorilactobacillus capillatus]|uniref:DMT family permease n=1 Tax=Liquorilactobacillus capillatus DSM 19910 TaxID=1423731 RepID=A0A0R1M7W4_9LACO|nr:DMT family transporter [Liquorilactobacillus capillatus]KRL01141.1 DMT family permease [Liquorilactobacillus capillatus DSM 19910]